MIRRNTMLAAALALGFCTSATRAQEVAVPAEPTAVPATTTQVNPLPVESAPVPKMRAPVPTLPQQGEAPGAESQLMPDAVPPTIAPPRTVGERSAEPPKSKKEEKIGVSKTEVFSQDIQEKIRFREVETRALADKGVQAAWDRSVIAHTPAEKREALKEYYKLLYVRMQKIDSTLKTLIETRALAAQNRLTQKFAVDSLDDRDSSTSGRVFAE